MLKVIDNYIHNDIAKEIYNSVVNRFNLSKYKSTCCYDSLMDRAGSYNYIEEADFLFGQYENLETEPHHFYINGFQQNSRSLGLHNSRESLGREWSKHLILLLGEGEYAGGDYYFLEEEEEIPLEHPTKEDFSIVEFKQNRMIACDTETKRLVSFLEKSDHPAVHINLLLE